MVIWVISSIHLRFMGVREKNAILQIVLN